MTIAEGTLLWEPPAALREGCALTRYMRWLEARHGLHFADYDALWRWSVAEIDAFWASIWEFYDLRASQPPEAALGARQMPGASWFPGARLNYAEQVFRHAAANAAQPAIIFRAEQQPYQEISWATLEHQVAALAASLRGLGLQPGDRVAALLPTIPEAVVAFLACASLGLIWSSCSPDFGSPSVIDRFAQIAPKVLIAVDGYRYGGKAFERRAMIAELQAALPSLEQTVVIDYLHPEGNELPGTLRWASLLAAEAPLQFEQLPFDHPLWVLYSSGTTGLPKPIVHGHGGILLEHLKSVNLHLDIGPGDRFFWFTTTGWMMWNFLLGGLLVGATVLLFDGSPGYPDMGSLWSFAAASGMTFFGTSAAYVAACMKAGIEPARDYNLSQLRGMGYTGSPLAPEGFAWVYEHVGHLWLASISGGTDVCTAFVGGCPLLPVRAGETQCRCLGAAIAAYDEQGRALIGEVGELVIEQPLPSMPLFFWGDDNGERLRAAYFEHFPGVWRHGDWIKVTPQGGIVIYGRSDSTINRFGVRIGTSELYRAVEALPEVADSLVIDLEGLGGAPYMALFVVLRDGLTLDAALVARIKAAIRSALTPRHVPDEVFQLNEVPRTLNGKKLEVPIKKILSGTPAAQAASPDSLANPQALDYFVALAERFGRKPDQDVRG